MNYKRNEKGLLEGVEYIFNEDGTINWRAMIRPQYLYVKPSKEKDVIDRYKKELADLNPIEIDDKYLLITLGGIKHLLRLRGYRSVRTEIPHADNYKAVAVCTIEFVPNFETDGQPQIFSDSSSATMDSTSGFGRLYLESFATNRAFVRAVRNGLGINISSDEEFDEDATNTFLSNHKNEDKKFVSSGQEGTGASGKGAPLLQQRCTDLKISFEKLKERAVEVKTQLGSDPSQWTSFSSIQDLDAFTLINKINRAVEKKQKT